MNSIRTRPLVAAGGTVAFAGAPRAQFTASSNQAAWEAGLLSIGYTPVTESFDGIQILNMQPSGVDLV